MNSNFTEHQRQRKYNKNERKQINIIYIPILAKP